ncbi:hypothetical protein ABES02_21220 [Neobacillus pocheonensis]|uniref:YqgU-like beta propeller domain-containing protein n=1 Tax=Neobacillus pocheonensis TaxID=363869 RepID=UPI003D2B5C44
MNQLRGTLSIILIVLTLLLAACANKEQQKPKLTNENNKPKTTITTQVSAWKLPISSPDGEFYKIAGWLSDTELIYITNLNQTSNVYRYHLLTGKSDLIFKSKYPIVTVQISPSKKYLLIHSSPSSYEGLVTIIDAKGIERLSKSFASYELEFEWNPYNEEQILVSNFAEDWTFKVLLLDMKKANTNEVSLPQPFIKWLNVKNIAFLNWDKNSPSLFAPLIEKDLESGTEKNIVPSAIQFSAFPNLLMIISVNKQDQSVATYSFSNQSKNKIFTFSIPQLTNFSDWLVPFYDYNENKGQFYTLKPLSSGEMDSYTDGFQLAQYDLKKGTNKVIMDGLKNEPINISPSGEAILYGNNFEKMIDIKTKKIYELIKE